MDSRGIHIMLLFYHLHSRSCPLFHTNIMLTAKQNVCTQYDKKLQTLDNAESACFPLCEDGIHNIHCLDLR